jgi:hypothetical protein
VAAQCAAGGDDFGFALGRCNEVGM